MATLLELGEVADLTNAEEWEARRIAVRDFLNAKRVGCFTTVRLQLCDGSWVLAARPELATLIDPLPQDDTGVWPPDIDVLRVVLPLAGGRWVRLGHLEALELVESAETSSRT
jgi:hypothetical protein